MIATLTPPVVIDVDRIRRRVDRCCARMDIFIRTRREIRALPEIHDCSGHCSGHLRRSLSYAVVTCDVCGHVDRII